MGLTYRGEVFISDKDFLEHEYSPLGEFLRSPALRKRVPRGEEWDRDPFCKTY